MISRHEAKLLRELGKKLPEIESLLDDKIRAGLLANVPTVTMKLENSAIAAVLKTKYETEWRVDIQSHERDRAYSPDVWWTITVHLDSPPIK